MYDLTTRVAEIEAELRQSARYPHTYAADAIRSTLDATLSREDATDYIHNFAINLNIEIETVAVRLAGLQIRRMALDQVLDAASLKVDNLVGDIIHLDASEFATSEDHANG